MLASLLAQAFDVSPEQIVGPSWMPSNTKRYDVTVTFPAGTSKQDLRLMWQALLTERFGLQAHREAKISTVYAMTVPSDGAGILIRRPPPGSPGFDGSVGMRYGAAAFEIKGTMPPIAIARAVRSYLSFPLIDMTGLEGDYVVDLSIPRDLRDPAERESGRGAGFNPQENARRIGWNDVAFIKAVEKQLGLKIVRRDDRLEIVVIDHLEPVPTPN